ncbi:GIY-YIG nuclease family protein [Rhizobium etli]|nr:GIY-YIG nuclease family protein [Rhizobium etli]
MHAGSLWVSPTETLSNELGKDIISGGLATTLFVFIPDSSSCYVLTSFDGNVLYVGLTKNLKRGMAQHLDNREKVNPTNGRVVWFCWLERDDLSEVERRWMNIHTQHHCAPPILNKIYSATS